MYLVTVAPSCEIRAVYAIRRCRGDADSTADKNSTEDTTERQILDEYVIA